MPTGGGQVAFAGRMVSGGYCATSSIDCRTCFPDPNDPSESGEMCQGSLSAPALADMPAGHAPAPGLDLGTGLLALGFALLVWNRVRGA